jgi:hypothetical protein
MQILDKIGEIVDTIVIEKMQNNKNNVNREFDFFVNGEKFLLNLMN